jgi:peroxiredoxin
VAEEYEEVGSVDATIDGTPYRLTAYKGGKKQLFITFADASSGEETYGFRFLRATLDSVTRDVVLDFNFAYNPDCAFSKFTTCPLPPPENRIRSKVLAGERPPQKGLQGEPASAAVGDAGVEIGRNVSEYRATTLSGTSVQLGGRGGPLTLVNVWATWCTSCREEMQDLATIDHEYASRGLRVVAVSVDAGSETLVRRFVQRESLTFPVVHDRAGTIQKQYHIVGVPTSYLIGAGGRLLWQQVGGIHGNLPKVRVEVEKALRVSSGAAVVSEHERLNRMG